MTLVCRSCGHPLTKTFVDLGTSPLSNAFPTALQREAGENHYPLHVRICDACLLVQLEMVETPDTIFGDYLYLSSYSKVWLEHASRFADNLTERLSLNASSQVIEIASNDGYLLKNFVAKNIPVLGIEPAANVAKIAEKVGVPTRVGFFGRGLATELQSEGLVADLMVANNVLAHVPDLNDFVAGFAMVLKPEGVLTVEFPHLMRLMQSTQFDTIYHEHFSYFSLATASAAFERNGLRVFDVEELPTHGGSLRLYICRASSTRGCSKRVSRILSEEREAGLHGLAAHLDFAHQVEGVKQGLLEFLARCRAQGKVVAGYGAPAKATTLFNFCGIGPEDIAYTVDQNPYKQGRFIPGTGIPIYSPEKLYETKPDYVLILPWNLAEEICSSMAELFRYGTRFFVAVPQIMTLNSTA